MQERIRHQRNNNARFLGAEKKNGKDGPESLENCLPKCPARKGQNHKGSRVMGAGRRGLSRKEGDSLDQNVNFFSRRRENMPRDLLYRVVQKFRSYIRRGSRASSMNENQSIRPMGSGERETDAEVRTHRRQDIIYQCKKGVF